MESKSKSSWPRKMAALAFGIILASALFELALRVHNPLASRVRGNDILLPKNRTYIFEDKRNSRLGQNITHTKNSLGFRGAEQPNNFQNYLSIIAIGGSTTECFYLSDGTDWPNILGKKLKAKLNLVWLNNAGLDGHSTYGHTRLLRQHVLDIKPKVILFLVGANDVGRKAASDHFDGFRFGGNITTQFVLRTETGAAFLNIYRLVRARTSRYNQLGHQPWDLNSFKHQEISQDTLQEKIENHRKAYMQDYSSRIQTLIELCKKNGIEPIFITQPTLVGKGEDPLVSVNLETISIGEGNGELYWKILSLYNEEVLNLAQKNNLFYVDLANELPKSSEYFYDSLHMTAAGAKATAEIIEPPLISYLEKKYPEFARKDL